MSADLIRGLRAQIVDRLRDDILSGRLAEGERLSESQLVQRFGVSRGSIRESLVQLVHEGLLIAQPNRGVRVAPSAPHSIRDFVIPIRRAIEVYALRLFFDQLSDDDFRVWDEILEKLKTACKQKDFTATAELDIAIHRAILLRANQPDLLAIWSTIVARVRSHFLGFQKTLFKNPMRIYTDHRDLIDAFRRGNLEIAVKALEAHIVYP